MSCGRCWIRRWSREGLRRLRLRRRIGAALQPDPGSDIGRVCALESTHYLRNQLLRDADWAGMAHGVEIRVPLVDFTLLRTLAPVIPAMRAGAGKLALAQGAAGDAAGRSRRARQDRFWRTDRRLARSAGNRPGASRRKGWRRAAGRMWCSISCRA